MPNVKFTQAARVEPEQIEPLRAIMLESFPPEEIVDFDDWLKQIAEGKIWLYVAKMHRTMVGVASVVPWVNSDTHLLECLAVGREHRNQTIGAQLLQHVVKSLRALGTVSGIIWEVESDDTDEIPDAERDLRKRRIAFYERNGAQVVECAPRYRSFNAIVGGEPLKMKLMWLPLNDKAEPPRGAKLRECVVGIHTLDYGVPPDNALTQAVLKDLVC